MRVLQKVWGKFPITLNVRISQSALNCQGFPNLLILQPRTAGEQIHPLPIRRETIHWVRIAWRGDGF
jgi:hypothetical protein